jgi:hypothetical protein
MSKIVCLTLRARLSEYDLTLLAPVLFEFDSGDNPPASVDAGAKGRLVLGNYPDHNTISLHVRDGFDPDEVKRLAREHFANQRTGIQGREAVEAIDP